MNTAADVLPIHSIRFLEMAFRTDRRKALPQADGHGKSTGVCGDTVEFFIAVEAGCIQSITYLTDGCMHTNACANTVAELVENGSVDAAWELRPEHVAGYLETLPGDHYHCAELAAGALYRALTDIEKKPAVQPGDESPQAPPRA